MRVDDTGERGPTRGTARGPGWRPASAGFHVPARAPGDLVEQRILEQAVRLPEGGAVTGWAACRLHGVGFCDGLARDGVTRLPVPLCLGKEGNIRGSSGVTLGYERLPASERTVRHGIPVVTAERAVFDAMRFSTDDREAVVVLDMAVIAGMTSIERVAAYVAAHPGWRAVARARFACRHAREGSRSPNETRLRLVWTLDAGLPRPEVNCPVHDLDGSLLGVADLFDAVAGQGAEFDGAEHRGRRRHTRDLAKDDAFRRRRIEVTRVTGTDLADTALVVDRLLAARQRAAFEGPSTRLWVARPVAVCADAELRAREELAAWNARDAFPPDGSPISTDRPPKGS